MHPFLPGQFTIEPGGRDDYRRLARFHYRAGPPATFCLIRRAVYRPAAQRDSILAAVATLSWPTLRCHVREAHFGLAAMDDRRRADWLAHNLRTISRVIVHPRFRALGVASALIRRLCDDCPTRHIESIAAMGLVHPMFERAGMIPITPTYFVNAPNVHSPAPLPNPSSSFREKA